MIPSIWNEAGYFQILQLCLTAKIPGPTGPTLGYLDARKLQTQNKFVTSLLIVQGLQIVVMVSHSDMLFLNTQLVNGRVLIV